MKGEGMPTIFKLSQSTSSLHFGTNTKTGEEIVYIIGDTYPIRSQLGSRGLGFKFWKDPKIGPMWYMPKKRFEERTPDILHSLSQLHVNVSRYGEDPKTDNPQGNETVKQEEAAENPKTVVTNKTDTDARYDRGMRFPINSNIYEEEFSVEVDGETMNLHITFARNANNNYKVTIPEYSYTIKWGDQEVFQHGVKFPKGYRWNKSGPNYDEDKLIEDKLNSLKELYRNPEKNSHKHLRSFLNASKRDSELKELIQEKKNDYKFDTSIFLAPQSIYIDKYNNNFDLEVQLSTWFDSPIFSIDFYTKVDHQYAPTKEKLGSVKIPSTIRTIDELNEYISTIVGNSIDVLTKKYVAYLDSFAYTEQQQQQAQSQMADILNRINDNNIDVPFFKQKLMEFGYIRPSKKGKNLGEEMVPQGAIKLIIDDKAIRETALDYQHDYNYVYSAIAYYLMRMKHNNIGWMPFSISDTIRHAYEIIARFADPNLTEMNFAKFIKEVTQAIFSDLMNKTYRSREEIYNDFYSGNYSGDTSGVPRATNNALMDFARYVNDLGGNPDIAINNPVVSFREMSKK